MTSGRGRQERVDERRRIHRHEVVGLLAHPEELDRQLGYWREQLRGAPQVLTLPADRPRPAEQSSRGAIAKVTVDAATTARLAAVAHEANASDIAVLVLAGFVGYTVISKVPNTLHTPLMSGSNFVHGIVVVGGIFALLNAKTPLEQAIGFTAVLLGAGNAAGGYAVTVRMLAMFKSSDDKPPAHKHARAHAHHAKKA